MKVVWVSHSGGPIGGAELALIEATKALLAKGVDLRVVLPWHGDLVTRLDQLGVSTHVTHFSWWVTRGKETGLWARARNVIYNISAARKLARYLRSSGADVVVSNTLASPVGSWAAALARAPHVWYVHELFGRSGHDLYFDLGERLSLALMRRLSDTIIANSHTVLSEFKKHLPADKLRVIYFGIDVPEIEVDTYVPEAGLNLIHVGILSPGKRQEDVVRALAMLAGQGLDLRLTLLGDEHAEYGSRLRELSAELGVEERVRFVPFVVDPFSYIAAADCLVTCSRGEGFGRVTVEAMKLGKPVVGAESGGTAELVRDGETGLLFRVGDVDDLARKLESLYRDRTLLAKMGRNAREWACANFNLEKYSTELLDVLEAAVASGSTRASLASAQTIT